MVESEEDWRLQDWMAHFRKRQVDMVHDLGWDKARANFVFHNKQPYRREVVNEISRWLGIKPFELLMRPSEALALRRLRETAALIVAEEGSPPFEPAPPARPPKGGGR